MTTPNLDTGAYEFEITVARYSSVIIKADSQQEARDKVAQLPIDKFKWDNGFNITEVEEHNKFGTMPYIPHEPTSQEIKED